VNVLGNQLALNKTVSCRIWDDKLGTSKLQQFVRQPDYLGFPKYVSQPEVTQ